MTLFTIGRTFWQGTSVRHHAIELLLIPMKNNVYSSVARYFPCTKNHQNNEKRRRANLFSPSGLLDWVTIDILDPLPKTEGGNMNIILIANRYWKQTKAIATAISTATRTADLFMEHLVNIFGISSTVLTDNGLQFTFKFFTALFKQLCVKVVTTTGHHPQANGSEHFNATMISRLRHYVAEQGKDWGMSLLSVTYAYTQQAVKLPRFHYSAWKLLEYIPDLLP